LRKNIRYCEKTLDGISLAIQSNQSLREMIGVQNLYSFVNACNRILRFAAIEAERHRLDENTRRKRNSGRVTGLHHM